MSLDRITFFKAEEESGGDKKQNSSEAVVHHKRIALSAAQDARIMELENSLLNRTKNEELSRKIQDSKTTVEKQKNITNKLIEIADQIQNKRDKIPVHNFLELRTLLTKLTLKSQDIEDEDVERAHKLTFGY